MSVEELNRIFKAAKILAPAGMQSYGDFNPAGEASQALDRRMKNPCKEIEAAQSPEELKALIRKKWEYGGGYAYPQPPFTMRLLYNGVCDRQFVAGDKVDLVFNLFSCCQELLDDYEIKDEPERIEWQVYRTPYRHPKAESRVHPRERDPRAGSWIPIMSFRVQEVTPFFSFEELELAHEELWRMVPEYARRKMNPCGEIPLVDQRLGEFLPMR